MRRIIIYAMGKLFYKYQKNMNWNDIIAIADKKVEDISDFSGIPLIEPQQIAEYSFDYIAIFSDGFFEEIKRELVGDYFIPEKKIISWRFLVAGNNNSDINMLTNYKRIFWEFQIHRGLDVGMQVFPKYFFSAEEIFSNYNFQLDGVGKKEYLIGKNLYRKVFHDIEENDNVYDVILLWNHYDRVNQIVQKMRGKVKYLLLHALYSEKGIEEIEKVDKMLVEYPIKKRIVMSDMIFWMVDLSPKTITEDIKIFVVTHKLYNVKCDDMYCPICVGNTYRDIKYLSDNQGENIAYLNEKLNECTALYWIWKNTGTKYIGLNHYRRYFYNNGLRNSGNYLDKETAYKYLEKYDIVLAIADPLYNKTVLDQIMEPLDKKICVEAYEIVRNALLKYQPDYIDIFDYVMHGHKSHLCHMFITHRGIFNRYCEWLFSFLIEAAERFEADNLGEVEKRAIGFFAERLLTVWVLKQDLKIKELPYVMV